MNEYNQKVGDNAIAYLILVRHSISRQQPGVSAHTWQLTDVGLARCTLLAEQLQDYTPEAIITSTEPKALQTGQTLADAFSLTITTDIDLGEHRRKSATYFDSEAEFRQVVRNLLTTPDQRIFGEETGTQAYQRFRTAIDKILTDHAGETVIVVTHGTVLSLFLAQAAGVEPVEFWESLRMPAYVILDLPEFKLVKRVSEVK